jgi:tetratricopeptide (TPR) repeat protein
MTFKLDYYYDMTEFKKLESLILQLLQIENQPESFKIQLYYFYSKTLMYFRRPEEAKKYANYVIQNVESLYHTFEDPLRMVEIANMEYVFGDKQKAYKLLLVAENKFGDRNDPIFHLELNTNKGHIFYQWKNYQRAERFYRRAVNWINNTGHDDKLMVAYSNLARVNQFLLKYEEALTYYQKTYALLQLQQDNNFIYVIALRIAEVKLKMKDIDEAIDYFELVEFDELSPHYHESYISLLKALNVEQ